MLGAVWQQKLPYGNYLKRRHFGVMRDLTVPIWEPSLPSSVTPLNCLYRVTF
jgi:hypothetical protein